MDRLTTLRKLVDIQRNLDWMERTSTGLDLADKVVQRDLKLALSLVRALIAEAQKP